MRASMSTITWMSFPAGQVTGVPYAAAPAAELLPAARQAGFRAVGLDLVTLGQEGDQAAAWARDNQLEVTDIGVLRIGQSDGQDQARRLARLAAASGTSACATSANGTAASEPPVCEAVVDAPLDERVTAMVAACCDILAARGIRMALEFMAYGPLGTLSAARQLCDRLGWDRCGLLLDSWHLMHAGTSWDEVAALSASQIALVQVSDGPALAGDAAEFARLSRWGRLPPGRGTFDFAPFLAALGAAGYTGYVSPEVLGYGERSGNPASVAMELKASLAELGIE